MQPRPNQPKISLPNEGRPEGGPLPKIDTAPRRRPQPAAADLAVIHLAAIEQSLQRMGRKLETLNTVVTLILVLMLFSLLAPCVLAFFFGPVLLRLAPAP